MTARSTSTGSTGCRKAMADQGVDVLLLSVGHDLPYLTGLRGDAAGAADDARRAPRRRGDDGHPPARGATGRRAAGRVRAAAVGRDRGPVGDRRRAGRRRRRRPRSATRCGPGSSSSCCRGWRAPSSAGPSTSSARCGWSRTPPRSRPCGPPARPPTGSPDQLHGGEIPLVGRTEAQVSADISARLIAEGHDKVNFAIVAAGENAASPHHHAGDRVIAAGEIVLCDFGGTMAGYCSDTTRCVFTGEPPAEIAEAYAVLHEAQQASVAAAVGRHAVRGRRPGRPADHRRRRVRRATSSTAPATASAWRSTRTPTSSRATSRPLVAGHAFSRRARHLRAGPVGDAAGGHRRRHRRPVRSRSTPPTTASSSV